MSSIFNRTPIEVWDPTEDAKLARAANLNIVTTAIDHGFVATAHVLADDLGIQFSPDTLQRWLRKPQTVEERHRRVYAALYYLKTTGRLPKPKRRRSKKS